MPRALTTLIAVLCLASLPPATTEVQAQTRSELLDFNWLFCEGEAQGAEQSSYDASQWKRVDLPHDWDIFHAPSADAPSGNDGGYYPGGVGWYRRLFTVAPVSGGHRTVLHFEGVYQRCQVWVNGTPVGSHDYGYTPFSIDITASVLPGKDANLVAVRVDNSAQPNCRWYSGSGIYRHVWLETYEDGAADDPSKLFVRTDTIYGISPDGLRADSAVALISYEGMPDERRTFRNVNLWSPSNPALYDVSVGRLTVKHGFRTFSYDSTEGFKLNGQPLLLCGACVHHDDGILGAMAFDAAEVRKVRLLKEAGFNAVRTSHNPAAPAFLNACDSLGLLVVDEAFDGWRTQKTANDYHLFFDRDCESDVETLVLRDRNHPSVIAWSIGNEVIERKEIRVIQTARLLRAAVLRHDDTRPVTEALCSWDDDWEIYDPHAEVLDIVGYNYMMHKHSSDHYRCPSRIIMQSESYPRDVFLNYWRTFSYPYIIGDFVWTGLDYLGESGIGQYYHDGEPDGEHYNGRHFPFHGAYCGDIDITGWRKPVSHYRELLWNRNAAPTLYMAVKEPAGYYGGVKETLWSVWPTWESWNWEGWEGRDIEVEVCSKAPAVSLYLNDSLVGTLPTDSVAEYKATFTLPYQSGILKAVSLDETGEKGDSVTIATAGEPHSFRLTPDRTSLRSDGQDVAFLVLEVIDSEGRVVPNASVSATIAVKGAGTLLSAGNANMSDLGVMTDETVETWHGRALVAVRTTRKQGKIEVEAKGALNPAKATLTASNQ